MRLTLSRGKRHHSKISWQPVLTLLQAYTAKKILSDDISRKIKSVDDFKPYAAELAKQLDSAFKPEPKKAENEKMFANQTVKSTAMMLMIMMKWVNTNGS